MAKKTIKLDKVAGKTVRNSVTFTDMVNMMGMMRSSGLTLPRLLCLSIVNENFSAKYPMVYPAEVECVYRSIVARPDRNELYSAILDAQEVDVSGWSYSAICRILRMLAKQGLLTRQRDGQYVAYGMTEKGIETLVGLFGEKMDKRPKSTTKKSN